MRIGVIGLGHVGFPIANYLHSLGYDVYSWSRSEKNVSWKNSVKVGDSAKIDLDLLFIASGAVKPSFGDVNVEIASTVDLVSQFRLVDSTKLVYISSGAVYGDCSESVSESNKPKPKTTYGRSKLTGELEMRRRFGENLTILRLGNIISETDPFGVVQQLIYAHQRKSIDFFGLPDDCRDYLEISDFLIAIESLICLDSPPDILNFGSGISITLGEIAELIRCNFNDEIVERWNARNSWDLSQTRLDVTRMKKILCVNPKNPKYVFEKLIRALDGTT